MDLSCSTNRLAIMQPHQHPPINLASGDNEDNLSMHSKTSLNSESEAAPPVSVRDMIKRYNSAAKANSKVSAARRQSHTLIATKSSFCGINKFGSQTSVKQYVTQIQESETKLPKNPQFCCVHNCKRSGDSCCPNRNRLFSSKSLGNELELNKEQESSNRTMSEIGEMKKHNSNLRVVPSKEKNQYHSNDTMAETNCHTAESSYQSKTTIAKTSSGVRIIIDIFFDQDQNMSTTDVVGSRVETDIPESRILNEFQQQAISNISSNVSSLPSALSANASDSFTTNATSETQITDRPMTFAKSSIQTEHN